MEENWKKLINSLAGLFCSSLNSLDETTTAIPTLSFQNFHQSPSHSDTDFQQLYDSIKTEWHSKYEEEAHKQGKTLEQYFAEKGISEQPGQQNYVQNIRRNKAKKPNIKYAALPAESVCTENLTPWMKLLPCRDQSGLGLLLNPLRVYDSLFHSMAVYVRSFPAVCFFLKDSVE